MPELTRFRRWLRNRRTVPPVFIPMGDGVWVASRHVAKITVTADQDAAGVVVSFIGNGGEVLGIQHHAVTELAPAWLPGL